jgi:molybdopterin-guanine dinucleotide biosynthesis protein A
LNRPVFLRTARGFGFPLALPVTAAPDLERLITTGRLSVQELAVELGASAMRLPRERRREVANANTPSDLDALRRLLAGEKN